jgi:hypothetical protein
VKKYETNIILHHKIIETLHLAAPVQVVNILNKIKNKKCHTFGTVPKFKQKIVERRKMDNP